MIYWHVDRRAACVYSQLKTCTSSEVAAMIEGVLRHCTEMTIHKQYVDSNGQREVGFAFCRLLTFDLLPRLKGIRRQKLYTFDSGGAERYPNLRSIFSSKKLNRDLLYQQYDHMVEYTTALQTGTAQTEDILRRTDEDRRGLTPLIFRHVNPYGSFLLDMTTRIPLDPIRSGPKPTGRSSGFMKMLAEPQTAVF
jgi:TnpA family transposase